MSEKILRIQEVSDRVGLSVSTVKRLVRDGIMPLPVQLSERALGWHESSIDAWVKDRPVANNQQRGATR